MFTAAWSLIGRQESVFQTMLAAVDGEGFCSQLEPLC